MQAKEDVDVCVFLADVAVSRCVSWRAVAVSRRCLVTGAGVAWLVWSGVS